jgi:hypothetical protein
MAAAVLFNILNEWCIAVSLSYPTARGWRGPAFVSRQLGQVVQIAIVSASQLSNMLAWAIARAEDNKKPQWATIFWIVAFWRAFSSAQKFLLA